MFSARASGLLLHITSLPGSMGMGDLGPAAFRFADFLAAAEQQVWQVLPLVPVGWGYSPYSSPSTFAGNPLLISPEMLVEDGLLTGDDLAAAPDFPSDSVDWERVVPFKRELLSRAFERFEADASHPFHEELWHFASAQRYWLDDYALYAALSESHQTSWTAWPEALAQRHPHALAEARDTHARAIRMHQFWQLLFDRQWQALRTYCGTHGIRILGDLPIYVAHDSADVWANQHLFYLDGTGQPTVVAGVPPDYFSETGQRWGNPLYRWDAMRANGFVWWTQRMANVLRLVDGVRLDHFRGFAGYWEIPAHEEHAINGQWVAAPGIVLFETLQQRFGPLPVVAENLGDITPDVTALMEQFHFPGMAVLQFAFGGDATSDFLPHNYRPNLVAYTGTHDNDTLAGWWQTPPKTTEAAEHAEHARTRAHAAAYFGLDDTDADADDAAWAFVRGAAASVACLTIVPLQDVLGIGSEGRMNIPGRPSGNWAWRFDPGALTAARAEKLCAITRLYGRSLHT